MSHDLATDRLLRQLKLERTGVPIYVQLRAMNIIYETTKERGATILIPTAMVDAMNPASLLAGSLAVKPSA